MENPNTASPNQQKITKHPYNVLRHKIIMASVFLTTGLLFESSCSDLNVMKHVKTYVLLYTQRCPSIVLVPGQKKEKKREKVSERKERTRKGQIT